MKVDSGLMIPGAAANFESMATAAREAEEVGYDGLFTAETSHDPFFPHLIAAEHTTNIELLTGIAVAFARNPMTLAQLGYDMNLWSKGRFYLGIGSQIEAHITRRFSMPWSHPAARMREFVLAMRAIWDCWTNGTRLDFRGEFYSHTLMTPFFNPGTNDFGAPKVLIAAVGPKMTEVAGETADGVLAHGFTTLEYFDQVTMPAIEKGLQAAGKSRSDFSVAYPAFVVTGSTEEERQQAEMMVKGQIAFYGSTPAYRGVLELHGWGEAQPELNRLSKEGKWVEMAALVDDEMLNAFAVVAEPDRVASEIVDRWGGRADRINFYAPYKASKRMWADITTEIQRLTRAS